MFGHLTLEGFNFPDESAVPAVEVCCVISGLSKGGTSHCVEAQTPFLLSFQTLLSPQARLRPCPVITKSLVVIKYYLHISTYLYKRTG